LTFFSCFYQKNYVEIALQNYIYLYSRNEYDTKRHSSRFGEEKPFKVAPIVINRILFFHP